MNGRTITIDMDKPCKRCGKKGAADNGYCLKCVVVWIENGRKWPPSKTTARRLSKDGP